MKFYIPTSNLNLDNILQSEGIIPMPHYAHRCSGYKTFEQIEEVRSFTNIVLFKHPVSFQINDSGRYNFPILIELEDDKQTCDFADDETQEDVCLCNHRLNLTPTNCRIYFFSEGAYNLTLINTKSNKAIKYFEEYNIYPTASMLNLVQMPHLECTDSNEVSLFEDNVLDKKKGLLYGYILGNKMSVGHELAKQLKLTQELYNVLTNLISTPSNISIFEKKLEALLDEYKKVDEVEIKSNEEFNARFDHELGARFRFLKGSLIKFLKRIDCWDMVANSLCRRWNCSFLPSVSTLNNERDFIQLRNEIEKRTSKAIATYSKSIPNANLNGLKTVDNHVLFSDAIMISIVAKYIICNTITPEMLSANREGIYMDVMKDIVGHLKERMGEDKWNGSKEQSYVNSLYAFINDPASPFSLNEIDDLELKSIAAFMLKGQSFKDCVTYLRMNEVEDYRYVLSLWGCLCGYMEMNKDALSPVLSMENYRIVYKKMFGDDLAEISNNALSQLKLDVKEMDYELFKFILEAFKIKEVESIIKHLSEQKVSEVSIEAELDELLNTRTFKRATAQCKNARMALQVYLNRDNKAETKTLLEKSSLPKSAQLTILSKLGFDEPQKKRSKKKTAEQTSLFPELNEQGCDDTAASSLPMLDCFLPLDEKVKQRLEDNWAYTWKKHKNDRLEHIRHFINLCKKEGNGNSKGSTALTKVFTDTMARQTEIELLKYYGI